MYLYTVFVYCIYGIQVRMFTLLHIIYICTCICHGSLSKPAKSVKPASRIGEASPPRISKKKTPRH